MSSKNILLYITTVLIWGSTWLAIKFQINGADPMVSAGYRFALAAALLIAWCRAKKLPMAFTFRDHLFMALQGLFLFSINYFLVYVSEIYLTSGLVAVTHASIIFLNIFNGYLLLRSPVHGTTVMGAIVGIFGIGLIFWPEISAFSFSDRNFFALVLSFTAAFLSSLGNIISARNQRSRLPVVQTNAYGMTYGAAVLLLLSSITGRSFAFPVTPEWITALIYLAGFGSIAGFGFYLTLLGRIGADRAAYAILVVPVVALGISTLFEGYQWTLPAVLGLGLVVFGNFAALRSRQRAA